MAFTIKREYMTSEYETSLVSIIQKNLARRYVCLSCGESHAFVLSILAMLQERCVIIVLNTIHFFSINPVTIVVDDFR